MSAQTREPATVANVFAGRDPDARFVEVMLEFSSGGYQAFGFQAPDRLRKQAAIVALCELFRVDSFEAIRGRPCTALRAWPSPSEPIEGLEVDGQRFTVTGFFGGRTAFDRRRLWLETEIDWAKTRLHHLEDQLARLPQDFVDWDST